MGTKHEFRALKNHATKELTFKQKKSMGRVPDSEGECAAVALMWVAEKITATRNPFRRQIGGDFAHAGHDTIHEHNEATMLKARNLGRAIRTGRQLDDLEQALGLTSVEADVAAAGAYSQGRTAYDAAASLMRLAHALRPGTGACMQMDLSASGTAGHLIAMYRSRTSKLHFIDPNAGIYDIHQAAAFFASWVDAYRAQGLVPEPKLNGSDTWSWCRLYPRR